MIAPPLLARAAAPALFVLAVVTAPSVAPAGSPYQGWRGQPSSYGTPYTAYKAGAVFDDDRRPFDGSYRSPAEAPLTNEWAGLYFGADLGAGLAYFDTGGLAETSINAGGFMGGIHAGYNMQFGNVVAGFETDTAWAGTEGDKTQSGSLAITAGSDWLSSARLRLGYAMGNWLVYATGGVALGDVTVRLEDAGIDETMSHTAVGYAAGGGVEFKFTPSWIARAEAIHYGFGDEEFKSSLGSISADTDVTTIRAGLSVRLN